MKTINFELKRLILLFRALGALLGKDLYKPITSREQARSARKIIEVFLGKKKYQQFYKQMKTLHKDEVFRDILFGIPQSDILGPIQELFESDFHHP
ncbi:MAG: hypothetical protein WCF92_01525 [bacterium]